MSYQLQIRSTGTRVAPELDAYIRRKVGEISQRFPAIAKFRLQLRRFHHDGWKQLVFQAQLAVRIDSGLSAVMSNTDPDVFLAVRNVTEGAHDRIRSWSPAAARSTLGALRVRNVREVTGADSDADVGDHRDGCASDAGSTVLRPDHDS